LGNRERVMKKLEQEETSHTTSYHLNMTRNLSEIEVFQSHEMIGDRRENCVFLLIVFSKNVYR